MIILNDNFINDDKIYMDRGFDFGCGVFETILVKNKPVFLKEHLKRLNKSLGILGINKMLDEDYVLKNVEKLNCKNSALKIMVSDRNTLFKKRDIHYSEEDYQKGFDVKVSNIRRNPYSHIVYMKTLNYADNLIERNKAMEKGYKEVIFLNINDYLAEGSVSNLFFIKDNVLYTPIKKCGLLDGVVRKWVLNNYNVKRNEYTLNELLNCDGAFLTNSLLGIMKINSVDGILLKDNKIIEEISNEYEMFLNNY